MELESLKYIWHSLETPRSADQDRTALLALLERRSGAHVARMIRNLAGEAVVLLAAYVPVVLCLRLGFGGRLAAISWLFVVIAVFFFTYYYRKYRLLEKMQCPTCQVRSNLARELAALKRYTGFYLFTGTLMVPLTYLLSWIIIRWRLPAYGSPLYQRLHPVPWWASPAFGLILLVPLTIGIYYANAWYIHKLYGRHIKKLQELLREMESE